MTIEEKRAYILKKLSQLETDDLKVAVTALLIISKMPPDTEYSEPLKAAIMREAKRRAATL